MLATPLATPGFAQVGARIREFGSAFGSFIYCRGPKDDINIRILQSMIPDVRSLRITYSILSTRYHILYTIYEIPHTVIYIYIPSIIYNAGILMLM